MAISRQSLTELRRRLSTLYSDPADIRRLAVEAGLQVARINMGGSAVNIWHAVLEEAQKVGALNRLVNVVVDEYSELESAIQSLFGADFVRIQPQPEIVEQVPITSPQPAPPTPQPPPASVVQPQPAAPVVKIDRPRALRLQMEEEQLLSALFRQASRLRILSEFTDGRTATRVFLIRPTDQEGVDELPAVAKIGPRRLIEPEWQATQQHVLRRLPDFIPIQGEPIYLALNGTIMGALRYGQVGNGLFPVESLAHYLTTATAYDSWHVLENRLFSQLGYLWQNTLRWQALRYQNSYDGILPVNLSLTAAEADGGKFYPLDGSQLANMTDTALPYQADDLVQLTNFVITEVAGQELTLNLPRRPDGSSPSYRLRLLVADGSGYRVGASLPPTTARVTTTRLTMLQQSAQAQLGTAIDLVQPTIPLPDHPMQRLPNPLLALPDLLMSNQREAKFATIHGDLNLRNVLVDPQARTTHIIDCAAARQDHALQDLLRLERDYLTDVFAALCFEQGLPPTTIIQLYRWVHCALRGKVTPGQFSLPADLPDELRKPFILLVTLRRAAHSLLAQPGQWVEYYTGLIIHLVGALKFRDLDNVTAGQQPKALAFWGAAAMLEIVEALKAGDDRHCREGNWRFFDLTKEAHPGARQPEPLPTTVPTHPQQTTQPSAAQEATAERITPPSSDPAPAARPIKILFLAASPLDAVRVNAEEEARAIDLVLRQSAHRNFVIHFHGAVRTDDLQALLLRHEPDIVHFCGHGSQHDELVFVGPTGNSVKVSGAALRQLFTVLKGNIRCIILNACYTAAQAEGLAAVIDCVIGIDDAVSGEAARHFASAFYQALGYAKSIGEAFALGKNQIELAGLNEAPLLHLLTRTEGAATRSFREQ